MKEELTWKRLEKLGKKMDKSYNKFIKDQMAGKYKEYPNQELHPYFSDTSCEVR
jgi:hypothetical protein